MLNLLRIFKIGKELSEQFSVLLSNKDKYQKIIKLLRCINTGD
jgi:hypothetical protein